MTDDELGTPDGYSYAAIAVRTLAAPDRPGVLDELRRLRFSGWVGPDQDGWTIAVADEPAGVTAGSGRGVFETAAALSAAVQPATNQPAGAPGPAESSGAPVIAIRVVDDRQLALGLWRDGQDHTRYLSDPAYGLVDETVLPDAVGLEETVALAEACDRADRAEELMELLADDLDHDSVLESERLRAVLELLGLPGWIVASAALPKWVPTGPPVRELTRLRVGRSGPLGLLLGVPVRWVRRRRTPPPIVADPPPMSEMPDDPWLM